MLLACLLPGYYELRGDLGPLMLGEEDPSSQGRSPEEEEKQGLFLFRQADHRLPLQMKG